MMCLMCTDCLLSDESSCNVPIAISTSELSKNLHFPRGERIVAGVQPGKPLFLGDSLLASMDLPNRIQRFAGRHTLNYGTISNTVPTLFAPPDEVVP